MNLGYRGVSLTTHFGVPQAVSDNEFGVPGGISDNAFWGATGRL